LSPREAGAKGAKPARRLLPRIKGANVLCPRHGSSALAGPNARRQIVCLQCGWTAPYDHRVVLTPRVEPNEER